MPPVHEETRLGSRSFRAQEPAVQTPSAAAGFVISGPGPALAGARISRVCPVSELLARGSHWRKDHSGEQSCLGPRAPGELLAPCGALGGRQGCASCTPPQA